MIQREKKIKLEGELGEARLDSKIRDKKDEIKNEDMDVSIDKFFDKYKRDKSKRD